MDVAGILRRAATIYAGRPAVLDTESGETLSYAELLQRVERTAYSLLAAGVEAGDRVAVLSSNCTDFLVLLYALPMAGAVGVLLNFRQSQAQLSFIVRNSRCSAIFAHHSMLDTAAAIADEPGSPLRLTITSTGHKRSKGAVPMDALPQPGGTCKFPPANVDAVTLLMYTSGTTGLPKGAALTHRNIISNMMNLLVAFREPDGVNYVHVCPMFHAADGESAHRITSLGGCHIIVPKFDPEHVLKVIQEHKVASSFMIPTMVNWLVNHPKAKEYDLSSLQVIGFGGAPMPADVLKTANTLLPHCRLVQAYGMTECSPVISFLENRFGEDPRAQELMLSCGYPVPNMEINIQDEHGNVLGVRERGEVCCRGSQVMKEYWKDPISTDKAIIDGWMHTGDVGFLDEEGYLYLVDRVKDTIITGGENVFSVEVENVLYAHPDVKEAAVIATPSEKWGEVVTAIIYPTEGSTPTAESIEKHCRALLGGYQVPRKIIFSDEPLPKGGTGKIMKKDLRAPYWEEKGRMVN